MAGQTNGLRSPTTGDEMKNETKKTIRDNHFKLLQNATRRAIGTIDEWTRKQGVCLTNLDVLPPVNWDIPMTTHTVRLYKNIDHGSGLRGQTHLDIAFKAWEAIGEETPEAWQVLEWIGHEGSLARVTTPIEYCEAMGYPEAREEAAEAAHAYIVARTLAVEEFLGSDSYQWFLTTGAPASREV